MPNKSLVGMLFGIIYVYIEDRYVITTIDRCYKRNPVNQYLGSTSCEITRYQLQKNIFGYLLLIMLHEAIYIILYYSPPLFVGFLSRFFTYRFSHPFSCGLFRRSFGISRGCFGPRGASRRAICST